MPKRSSRISTKPRFQSFNRPHKAYVEAVEGAFGADVDYAQLVKIYGKGEDSKSSAEIRCCPAQCMGCEKQSLLASPITDTFRPVLQNGKTSRCG
jgi:hypothetical protein